MDGPSVEHSDSDSGESWTLLENTSVYADEPPEFIEDQDKKGAQNHEKDEDTDGISIISDSDHDTPSPLPGDTIYDKCQIQEKSLTERDISEYVSVEPNLSNIDNDDREPEINEDFLGDSHARHKTYVHKRNKRLSTVLNIIVLGSVITAAGVAIGHMWGAKYDCTMPSTSAVNKILSNLYKLQEENAYLRNKLKELTFSSNHHLQNHKLPLKHNKCKKVFEESLNSNEPKKVTKCVDENYNNADILLEHLTKPKFEKEFIADVDKLRTVYLQNKSWLDDEISRRMKIEEELLKKYNAEVNSAKEQKKASELVREDTEARFELPDSDIKISETLDNHIESKAIEKDGTLQNRITYADSLQSEHKSRFKRNEDQHAVNDDSDWLTLKQNEDNKQDPKSNPQPKEEVEPKLALNENSYVSIKENNLSESTEKVNNNVGEFYIHSEDWIEVKPKLPYTKERYDTYHTNPFEEQKQDVKEQETLENYATEENPKLQRRDDSYNWPKNAQETKKMRKKAKRDNERNANKKKTDARKNYNDEDRILEYLENTEEYVKDDRYAYNKLKQEKKRNSHINFNKKQKRKGKFEKNNMKGEFGEEFEAAITPEDVVYPDKKLNSDPESYSKTSDDISKSANDKDFKEKPGKFVNEGKKIDNKEDANWFAKRAAQRTEARKKYYEQFRETSPNNSSWYFRRMRKREQCRAKADNSTFRKVQKEKKYQKMKY